MHEVRHKSLDQEANEALDACVREILQIQSFLDDRCEGVPGDLVLACPGHQVWRLQVYILLEVTRDGEAVTEPFCIENPSRIFGEHAGLIGPDDPAAVLIARALRLVAIHERLADTFAEIHDTLDEAFFFGVVNHGREGVEVDDFHDGEWYRAGGG